MHLIWGADDAWQVIAWAHRLRQAIPGSTLELIEQCGHFAPEERPAEVADALLRFLDKQAL